MNTEGKRHNIIFNFNGCVVCQIFEVSEEAVPISISHFQFQMLPSMQLLCFYQQPPSSLFVVHKNGDIFNDKRFIRNPSFSSSSCFGIVRASLKEDSQSQQYEVEPEKAREALRKLDEQMQSLSSKKQPSNASKLNKSTLSHLFSSLSSIHDFFSALEFSVIDYIYYTISGDPMRESFEI